MLAARKMASSIYTSPALKFELLGRCSVSIMRARVSKQAPTNRPKIDNESQGFNSYFTSWAGQASYIYACCHSGVT